MSYEVKGAPFRYSGAHNVEHCSTAQEVMEEANLNWIVRKCKLVAEMPMSMNDADKEDCFLRSGKTYREVNNAFATYRTDYNIPLGIVKDKYEPVQNIDAFKFFDEAIGKDKAIWQTAGYFGSGERIFVSAKLPDDIVINGDTIENYLVFTTSHDGSTGVKILFTPIRVICQNTLNAAINNSDNYISFKHTMNVHNNLDIAADILGAAKNISFNLKGLYEVMSKTKISDEIAQNYFGDIILTEDEKLMLKNTGHTITELIFKMVWLYMILVFL